MAGLLDFLNTDDGRMGLGLLGAAAPSMAPMNFAGRLAQGMQNYQGMQQQQQKSKLLDMQMKNYESEIEARKLAGIKDARQQAMIESMFGGSVAGTEHGGAAGSPSGGAPQGGAAQGRPSLIDLARQYGIPEQAIQADMVFNGGKKISELLAKHGAPDMQVTGGYAYDKNKLGAGYLPSLSTSQDGKTSMVQIGPDGQPVVSAPRGALETFAGYQSAQASFKPIKVYNPATGREEYTSEGAVVGGQPAAGAGFPSGYAGGSRGAADAGRLAILREELSNPGLPPDARAALEREIARMQPAAGTPPAQAPQSGGFAAGPSNREKLSNEAGGKINETWLKTSYEPVIAGISATDDLLSSVRVARNAMDKMGGTGWGTEAKAIGANVLSGLGLSAGNSKMLASNAQVFQNAAMERLQSTLNLAKGPQTEGDAERASKTFAQLKNTTDANSFILDLAEARAQREKMKAAFYQQALPVAQEKGDLQEIDREWAKRTPSVFNLPSMVKWGVK